ncbi:MAG: putative endonuclease [Frankiales bacterium]|nr:putative endonuclease [Frankiales bacterium]
MSDLPNVNGKACLDCGSIKALEEFPAQSKRRDGRGSYCKVCMLERSRKSYRKRMAAAGRTVRDNYYLPQGHRRCPDCKLVLPEAEFPRNVNNRKDGRNNYCKPCHKARGEASKKRHHGSTRSYHLKARYGITEAQADAMLEAQGGLCAVCREQPAVHVDHDHLFGNVRGLTCFNFNGGLGQFKDRVDIMRKGIDYLERTRSTQWQRTLRCSGVYQLTSPRTAAASRPSSDLRSLISSRRS